MLYYLQARKIRDLYSSLCLTNNIRKLRALTGKYGPELVKSLGIRDVDNVESAKFLLSIVPECDRRTLVFQMPPLGFWDYDNLLHKACATGNTELAKYWLGSGYSSINTQRGFF